MEAKTYKNVKKQWKSAYKNVKKADKSAYKNVKKYWLAKKYILKFIKGGRVWREKFITI